MESSSLEALKNHLDVSLEDMVHHEHGSAMITIDVILDVF